MILRVKRRIFQEVGSIPAEVEAMETCFLGASSLVYLFSRHSHLSAAMQSHISQVLGKDPIGNV